MPLRAIKHQLTCPFERTSGSFLIGRRRILVIPRNHLAGFLPGLFQGGGAKSIVMLLFSGQISGRGKGFRGERQTVSGGAPPCPLWKKASLVRTERFHEINNSCKILTHTHRLREESNSAEG